MQILRPMDGLRMTVWQIGSAHQVSADQMRLTDCSIRPPPVAGLPCAFVPWPSWPCPWTGGTPAVAGASRSRRELAQFPRAASRHLVGHSQEWLCHGGTGTLACAGTGETPMPQRAGRPRYAPWRRRCKFIARSRKRTRHAYRSHLCPAHRASRFRVEWPPRAPCRSSSRFGERPRRYR